MQLCLQEPWLLHGQGAGWNSTVAGVLGVGVEVQVGDVWGDVLDIGSIGRHEAANVAPCRASTNSESAHNASMACDRRQSNARAVEVLKCLTQYKPEHLCIWRRHEKLDGLLQRA